MNVYREEKKQSDDAADQNQHKHRNKESKSAAVQADKCKVIVENISNSNEKKRIAVRSYELFLICMPKCTEYRDLIRPLQPLSNDGEHRDRGGEKAEYHQAGQGE